MRALQFFVLIHVAAAVTPDSLEITGKAPRHAHRHHSKHGQQRAIILSGSSLLRKEVDVHAPPAVYNDPYSDPDPNGFDPDDSLPDDHPDDSDDGPLPFSNEGPEEEPSAQEEEVDPEKLKEETDTSEKWQASKAARREEVEEKTGQCQTQYEAEDDWCEESCVHPDDKITLQFGMTAGKCADKGFQAVYKTMRMHDFAPTDSEYEELGIFSHAPECAPHFTIINGFCQSFCTGHGDGAGEGTATFVEHRHGINPGDCASNGYPKWIRSRQVTTYVK